MSHEAPVGQSGSARQTGSAQVDGHAVASAAWLWVSVAAAHGYVSCLRLLSMVGIKALWSASSEEFMAWGVRARTANALVAHRHRFDAEAVERRLAAVGARFIPRSHRRYPLRLENLARPPVGLFLKGDLERWDDVMAAPRVTIVGTRAATRYGSSTAEAVGRAFAVSGCVVISGLARGIDSRAHCGALAAGGVTVAVLGTGPDVIYPRQNASLYEEVGRKGIVVSEYPPGTPAARWRFPARNRLMAALGDALIVVEAGLRSGALLTVDEALDLGRDVFVVPGPIGSPASRGCNRLAAEGAHIVYDIEQCVKEYDSLTRIERCERTVQTPRVGVERHREPSGMVQRLAVQALSRGPRTVDEVAEAVGCAPREAAAALALLELEGLVGREGVGVYALPP